MNFSDYCKPFYDRSHKNNKLKGISGQADIAAFFLKNALGEKAYEYLTVENDTFSKYFSGKRAIPSETWNAISANFNSDKFAAALADKLNEKCLSELGVSFGIILDKETPVEKSLLTDALTEQFAALAANNGNCAPIVATTYKSGIKPFDCPDYIKNSYEKYSKIKTLLCQTEQQPFYDIFVCNTIVLDADSPMRRRNKRKKTTVVIENVTLNKLEKDGLYCLLVGMGGIGKSMMMHHLFLDSIQRIDETNKIPIIVTLRYFAGEKADFEELLYKSVIRFDSSISKEKLTKLLKYGTCQILLDGLDEIKATDLENFLDQLDLFIDRYPTC